MPKNARGRSVVLLVVSLVAVLLAPVAVESAGAAPSPNIAPVGLQPSSGTYADNPSLSWEPVTGTTLPVERYRVQVADNPDFISPLHNEDTTNTSFTPYRKLPQGTIYWRVAVNQNGLGSFSDVATFTIALAGPTPQTPPNGAQLEFPDAPGSFTWSAMPGADDYLFQYDNEASFASPDQITSATNGAILVGTPPFGEEYHWRVRANYPGGVASEWSASQTFSVVWPDQVGKGKPQLLSPPTTSPLTEITDIALTWAPVVGAERYQLQVALNQQFSGNLVFDSLVFGTSYSPPRTWDNGSYWWRVRARDRNGNLGPWSSNGNFARRWPIDPGSPNGTEGIPGVVNPPALLTPAAGANVASDPMVFEWAPIDRASYYELQVSNDENFSINVRSCNTVHTKLIEGNLRQSGTGEPGCDVSVFRDSSGPNEFPGGGGTLYWRVRGWDGPENIDGLWSATRSYTKTSKDCGDAGVSCPAFVSNAPVTYVGPADCPPNDVCENLTTMPEMRWQPDPTALSYRVWVALDAQFTNVEHVYGVDQLFLANGNRAQPVLYPRNEWRDNDAGQAYYWHVQTCQQHLAVQGAGSCSLSPVGQQNPHRFAFQKRSEGVVTTGPGQLHDPLNPGGPPPVETELPTLRWEDYLASNASNLEAQQYQVQVSQTDVFNSILDDKTVDQPFYHPFDRTYPEGPIYWRVRAIDASNNFLTWSDIRVFDYSAPPPTLSSPANNASFQGTPQFSWQTMPFARDYLFELYKNGQDPISPANRIDSRPTMYGDFTPYLDLPVGTYAWRVRRDDPQGRDGAWSQERRFTITEIAPQLSLPPANDVLTNSNFEYSWAAMTAATQYRFERSPLADFSSIVETKVTVMNSWAPTANIPSGDWYWRVSALDGANNVIGTSTPRKFTMDPLDLPGPPNSVTVTNRPGGLTIEWTQPTDVGDPAYTQWVIALSPGGIERTVPKGQLKAEFNGLMNNQTYNISVRAKSVEGLGAVAARSGTPNGCSGTPFADVDKTGLFCPSIEWLFGQNITNGSTASDGTRNYLPNDVVTRQAMASFLFSYFGPTYTAPNTPTFADVPKSNIFFKQIEWMVDEQITGGCGGSNFCPAGTVTRGQMAAFLYRAAGQPAFTPPNNPSFSDVPKSNLFYTQVEWLAQTGITGGCGGGRFCPGNPVRRQEMAAFLFSFDTWLSNQPGAPTQTPEV